MDKIKRILVTGSSGTIGTALCEKLLAKNYNIIGIDKRPNNYLKEIDAITIIGDLRDQENLAKLSKNIDLVIHLAANARVYNLVVDPDLAKDNFLMTYNTLEFCRKNKIKKYFFASSREVYGNIEKDLIKESNADFNNCESPYTATKIAGESLIQAYKRCYGIDFAIFRFSNVYGKYDFSDRVVPLFIKLTRERKNLTIFGQEKCLDFTYIDDSINGVIKCLENFEQAKNEVYNLADGRSISILEIAELIQKEMGSKTNLIIKKPRTGEVLNFAADISKAKKKFGYEPKTKINQGIGLTVKWYLENLK